MSKRMKTWKAWCFVDDSGHGCYYGESRPYQHEKRKGWRIARVEVREVRQRRGKGNARSASVRGRADRRRER